MYYYGVEKKEQLTPNLLSTSFDAAPSMQHAAYQAKVIRNLVIQCKICNEYTLVLSIKQIFHINKLKQKSGTM